MKHRLAKKIMRDCQGCVPYLQQILCRVDITKELPKFKHYWEPRWALYCAKDNGRCGRKDHRITKALILSSRKKNTNKKLQTMELTKKDKRHIEEEVRKLQFRIGAESREYARLYEKTYLEVLKKEISRRIDAIEQYNNAMLRISEPTKTEQL